MSIDQRKLEAIARDFPEFMFLPDSGSRGKECPNYFKLFYNTKYIGVLREKVYARSLKRPAVEIIDGLEGLTRLSPDICDGFRRRVKNAYS